MCFRNICGKKTCIFMYNQRPKDTDAPPVIVANIPIYLFYLDHASLADN